MGNSRHLELFCKAPFPFQIPFSAKESLLDAEGVAKILLFAWSKSSLFIKNFNCFSEISILISKRHISAHAYSINGTNVATKIAFLWEFLKILM